MATVAKPAEKRSQKNTSIDLEAKIDRHVYALYGLTPEEIKFVEGAGK